MENRLFVKNQTGRLGYFFLNFLVKLLYYQDLCWKLGSLIEIRLLVENQAFFLDLLYVKIRLFLWKIGLFVANQALCQNFLVVGKPQFTSEPPNFLLRWHKTKKNQVSKKKKLCGEQPQEIMVSKCGLIIKLTYLWLLFFLFLLAVATN